MKNDIRETNDEIRRLVGELDASLDGIPAEEIARESALKARAKQLDAEIVRLLSKAGLSRETVGADTLPSLRREAAERESERAGREGEAADVATRAASVRAEIAALDADIEETKKRRKNLADRIDSLSAEIRNRFLVEDVWYWIFGDETKAAKERAEGERAAVQKELDGLLGSIHEKKERRNALAAEEADLRRKEAEIAARIGENAARQDAFRKAVVTARENEKALAELSDLRALQESRSSERAQAGIDALKALKERIGDVLEAQPRIADLGPFFIFILFFIFF